ncbi:MAG: hypothetical protein R3286_06285, partial [Gammaproteobacteria bacterium]|nr:hypothetical protein [Gammaproteobacteria bacterium]
DRGVLAPTATRIPADARGRVLVCGSHGGVYAGYLAARAGVRAVVLNDAGVGLDAAGIGALEHCRALAVAAAVVAHTSARIGDAEDMLANGVISHCNSIAASLRVAPGMTCVEAVRRLADAPIASSGGEDYGEARVESGSNGHGVGIVCVDSVSLVRDDDVGRIVLSGSHGGVVAGQRHLAIRVAAAAAFYNDAGIGKDEAGVSRLPVLDERGIAAATVSAASARIGDGRSTYDTGIVSRANARAARLGIVPGMRARDAVERIPRAPI